MNRPEPVDHVQAIARLLGISVDDACAVLERASKDPLWPYRDRLGAFHNIVRTVWHDLQAERERRRGGGR